MSDDTAAAQSGRNCDPVLIIGAGLIGTSIGLALSAAGREVHLTDKVASHALVAASLGAGMIADGQRASTVIVAVPPQVAGPVVVQALREHPNATVTDVSSVKSLVVEYVLLSDADLTRYVGSHPMAGSHHSGPLTATADLFVDRTWVITPHQGAEPARIAQVRAIARSCGARVEVMTPAEHDQAVAEVSHVPQIISSLVAGSLSRVEPTHLGLAGPGVRDVTRLAGSDPGMWTQIITANHVAIEGELERLSRVLGDLAHQLDCPEAVTRFMECGLHGRKALPGKHGKTANDYVSVVVEIPDSPGALARLFSDVESAGVNVEDVSIEHDAAREVGYIAIAVDPNKADALSSAMVRLGWILTPPSVLGQG